MESVLSGRNLILELSLKVDEKKTCFFRGGRKLKAPKLDCGPERTDSILLNGRRHRKGITKLVQKIQF